ncbi:MAG TPA: MFS transporter [Methylomirabilota bacterium]|jgi:MFS family permease|nr:MFS transporter [Methylomirabilota bacterium]
MKNRARAVLGTAAATHFLHDGFSDLLYVLLPLWAAEFRLTFAQIGVIRTAYSGGMSLFQIPAGLLAERWGERRVLAAGTAVTALGFVAVAGADGFSALLLILLLAGLGSGVQHPLSSSLVSKAYETGLRRAALGTYNVSGDLGKVALTAAGAVAAAAVGWRVAGAAYGALGLVAAGGLLVMLRHLSAGGRPQRDGDAARDGVGWGIRDARGFGALAGVGMIDNATRTGFLTFLPFVLLAKGATVPMVGGALAFLFAGGAAGKFVCGLLAERLGVIRTVVLTELATAGGILVVLVAPLPVTLGVLGLLGIALNGTSSVLYGTVADLVVPARRSRAYGLYYTLSVGASALAPTVYGIVSDAAGVAATLTMLAALVLVTVPLCLALRPAVASPIRA